MSCSYLYMTHIAHPVRIPYKGVVSFGRSKGTRRLRGEGEGHQSEIGHVNLRTTKSVSPSPPPLVLVLFLIVPHPRISRRLSPNLLRSRTRGHQIRPGRVLLGGPSKASRVCTVKKFIEDYLVWEKIEIFLRG